jgi:hypothetical protein
MGSKESGQFVDSHIFHEGAIVRPPTPTEGMEDDEVPFSHEPQIDDVIELSFAQSIISIEDSEDEEESDDDVRIPLPGFPVLEENED